MALFFEEGLKARLMPCGQLERIHFHATLDPRVMGITTGRTVRAGSLGRSIRGMPIAGARCVISFQQQWLRRTDAAL
jgi:hypothetical protein